MGNRHADGRRAGRSCVRRVVFDALSPEQVEQLATITATVVASLKQAGEEDAYPSALPWHRR
ncbi:hypothetical protein QFZ55_006248 [Streptomyces luteogriseus]|nr:hypothetical protein [Streptomyces luteogriseus]